MSKGPYGRKDRLIQEKRHDAYEERDKLPENTRCSGCHALFVNGRWTWNQPSEKGNEVVCPACRRIADHYPAGFVEIKGPFFNQHRDEILSLIRHVENQEKSEHPMERIISIADEEQGALLTTTGIHIARRIGEALSRSYKGDFSFDYADDDKVIRGCWER
jgi:NMD protein affecting ribosome stability and mRNA decay